MPRLDVSVGAVVLGATAALVFALWRYLAPPDALAPAPPPAPPGRLALGALLSGPSDGFLVADAPRALRFPADHGPHPGFRTEWWYFTGNVADPGGRRFGYQLTFFRLQLAAGVEAGQVYMAHFAVTDVAGQRFHAHERVGRADLGLAGARVVPFRVWLDHWSAAAVGPGFERLALKAAAGSVRIDLTLLVEAPMVLQGESGLSRKSAGPGQASYYYSNPRIATSGTVDVGGGDLPVRGWSWLDREWSTSALAPDQVGWDWFALQLEDASALMFYRLRTADGGTHPFSAGTFVAADGAVTPLSSHDVELAVLAHWVSEAGARYPTRWRLRVPNRVPGHALELTVEPLLAGQEWHGSVRYWEGAVSVAGRAGERPVAGYGYLELTGYDDAAAR